MKYDHFHVKQISGSRSVIFEASYADEKQREKVSYNPSENIIRSSMDDDIEDLNVSHKISKEVEKLRSAVESLIPLVRETEAARLQYFSMSNETSKSRDETRIQSFLISWLDCRSAEAFRHIIRLPISQMKEAALEFRPICDESFRKSIPINGNVIKLISEKGITQADCLRAVTITPSAVASIPKSKLNLEIFEVAFSALKEERPPIVGVLKYMPKSLQNPQFCKLAVSIDGSDIQYVAEKSNELCEIACLQTGLAYDLLPIKYRTPKFEFISSLHRLMEKDPSQVFIKMVRAYGEEEALKIAEESEQNFIEMHFKNASEDDLIDIGFSNSASRLRSKIRSESN